MQRRWIAEHAAVEERGVAEVEQVVDHQLVVDVHLDPVALRQHPRRPGIEVREVRDEIRIRGLRSQPQPQHRVPLDHRVGTYGERRRDPSRPVRVEHARPIGAEAQAVVRALDRGRSITELTHAERDEPMRAAIFERHRRTIRASEEDDRLFTDRATLQFALGKVVGPQRRVPQIRRIDHGTQSANISPAQPP